MKQDANAVTLEYVNRWGDHHTLALYRDSYAMGGGFAISALDATDPADSEYLSPWSDITVNIPDNPDAAWWCATEGNVIIDTNNNSKELVNALVGAGIITLTDRVCHSGYCTYPLAKVAPWAMEAMDAIIRYWKGYVCFRGRASRSEYWWAMLFTFLVWFAFSLLDQSGSGLGALFSLLSACWGLATILPTIAISWRRLHDADKPGTFMFIVYGLYLIGYIMFFFGLFGAIGGAITGLSNGDASLLSGALGMGSIGLILIVAGLITNIVFMCLPSNPDGARFD